MPTDKKSPIGSASEAALNLNTQSDEHDVRLNGQGVRYLKVTASQDADATEFHEVQVNSASGEKWRTGTAAAPVIIDLGSSDRNLAWTIESVWLTSGKAGTTFQLEFRL